MYIYIKIIVTMKTIFTVILISISSLIYAGGVSVHNNTRKKDDIIRTSIQIAANELNIDSISVYISCNGFNENLKNVGGEGAVNRISKNQFVINICTDLPKGELIVAIIHEMVHVRQMIDRRLVIQKYSNWFEGILYTNQNSVYENRPYEKEAYDMSMNIYKKNKIYFKAL